VPSPTEFQYTLLRLVPSVERGERINVGVVVFCRPLRYLAARTGLDERRLAAQHVYHIRDRLKMLRVNAPAVPTQVVDGHAVRDRPHVNLVR
jgi:hypothetical protein